MTQTSTENVLEKRCSHCGEVKPHSEFYRNRGKPLGLAPFCKSCHRTSITPWMTANPEKAIGYQRKSRVVHRDEYNARGRARRALKTEKPRARTSTFQRWASERPAFWIEMRRAQNTYHNELRSGRIAKGARCEDCWTTEKRIEAAHYDYTRPLDIRWLCKSCHIRWDMANPKTRRGVAAVTNVSTDRVAHSQTAQGRES